MLNLPLNWARVALEPVRHKHLVFVVLVAGGQDIGALDSLVEITEDVKHGDDALGGVGRPSNICIGHWLAEEMAGRRVMLTSLHASKLLVRALGSISGGHNRRDVAAGLIVAVGSGHGRHDGGLEAVVDCRRLQRFRQYLCSDIPGLEGRDASG